MNSPKLLVLANRVWSELMDQPFDLEGLCRSIIADGGIDMEGVNVEDCVRVIEGERLSDAKCIRLGFGLSETIACYLASGSWLTASQVVGSIVASCMLASCSSKSDHDWSQEHSKILRLYQQIYDRVSVESSILALRFIVNQDFGGEV